MHLKVQNSYWINQAIRYGSRCPAWNRPAPAPPGGWACPASACPSRYAGRREEGIDGEEEEEECPGLEPRVKRRHEPPGRVRGCWKAAGWAVCCVSSGCPCGRTSSGSAQPAAAAAGSTPVGSGSAERPPVRGEENSKSGSRSSVEDSAPSSGD